MDFGLIKENAEKNVKSHSIFAALSLINTLTFITITAVIIAVARSIITNSADPAGCALRAIAAILFIVIYVFLTRIIRVIFARCVLEGRIYETVAWNRIFYLRADQERTKSSFTYMKEILVHEFLKTYYSALYIPFVLAENPTLSYKEASELSREIIKGHKMEVFKADLSMFASYIIAFFTIGLAGMPYVYAVHAEYYAILREAFMKTEHPLKGKLNDRYLYEVADEENLKRMYKNIKVDEMYVKETSVTFRGLQAVLCNTFAILIGNKKEKKIYHGILGLKEQLETDKAASIGKAYPSRLSPAYTKENIHLYGNLSCNRSYTLTSLIQLFLLTAVCAWIMETSLAYISSLSAPADFVRGPWQPIAALAGILSMTLLTAFRKNPVVTFIGTLIITVACSMLYRMPVDFTDMTYIITIIAGTFTTMAFIYIVAPITDFYLMRKRNTAVTVISFALFVVILADIAAKAFNITLPF